jgi:hypothetical protein
LWRNMAPGWGFYPQLFSTVDQHGGSKEFRTGACQFQQAQCGMQSSMHNFA